MENFNKINRVEENIFDLCEEIDDLREQVTRWKRMYEDERDANMKQANERFEEVKQGVGNALMFALSIKDDVNGSLIIGKEDREQLAKRFKSQTK